MNNSRHLLFISVLIFFSCQKDLTDDSSYGYASIVRKLNAHVSPEPDLLFRFTNMSTLKDQIVFTLKTMEDDAKAFINAKDQVTDVLINIKLINGSAIITEIHVYDKKKELLRGYLKCESEGKFKPSFSRASFSTALLQPLPDAYIVSCSCTDLTDAENCISIAINTFVSNHFKTVEDCVEMSMTINKQLTTIYGTPCENTRK